MPENADLALPRIGELFAGYGGLGMGVQAVLGGRIAWFSEFDKGPSKVLAHRFPGIPNHGDITKIDWSTVEPVDVLTGGSPCQDLSHAGKRQGMTEGTRSNLWVAMREAIAQLRPSLVVWENVRGAYSAPADSEVEPCPGCVGDGTAVSLRALGRVLGDLSDLGYVGGWHGLRAADVGAPHGRFRVFVVAHLEGDTRWLQYRDGGAAGHAASLGRDGWKTQLSGTLDESAGNESGALLPSPRTSDTNGAGQHGDGGLDLRTAVAMLPTPRATDGTKGGPNQRGSSGDLMLPSAVALLPTPTVQDGANNAGPSQLDRNSLPLNTLVTLLPTPAVNDMGEGKTPDAWDEWTAKMQAAHGNGNGHGKSLAIEAQRLLPTTTVQDARASGGNPDTTGTHGTTLTDATVRQPDRWGQYAPAIARWEALIRPAPAPTELSAKGSPRLSARFSEWLMGLPDGWVTDVPGVTRNEALKLCGNGVVPQQAAAAVSTVLTRAATYRIPPAQHEAQS